MINVLIAFENENISQKISSLINNIGFNVIGICSNGADVIRKSSLLDGGIVICGYKFKDMTALSLRDYLPEGFSLLVILSSHESWNISSSDILCLNTPVSKNDLISSLNMLSSMMSPKITVSTIKTSITDDADDKSIVDKAKALLMDKYNMTEDQAHRFIQKKSMDCRSKRVDTARIILQEVTEIINPY